MQKIIIVGGGGGGRQSGGGGGGGHEELTVINYGLMLHENDANDSVFPIII